MQLRPHQIDGLNAMKTHNKGQIIVPTGGGKTMSMIEDVRRLLAQESLQKKVVVVEQRIHRAKQ